VKIERASWFKPRYVVTDAAGHQSVWQGNNFRVGLSAEMDGHRCELRQDSRKRFVLLVDGVEAAEAIRWGREWQVHAAGSSYDLLRASRWRSRIEVVAAGETIGTVRRGSGPRSSAQSDLPGDLPLPVQALIGFVAMMTWRQEASVAGTGAGAIATGG
jgi:hypothetical protein